MKPAVRKGRKPAPTARAAATYRGARRNAWRTLPRIKGKRISWSAYKRGFA